MGRDHGFIQLILSASSAQNCSGSWIDRSYTFAYVGGVCASEKKEKVILTDTIQFELTLKKATHQKDDFLDDWRRYYV